MRKLILAASTLFTVGMSHANNQVPLIVDTGTGLRPTISVTICSPTDASICKTIDKIIVDTGSSGLHISDSALDMPGDKDSLRKALLLAKNANGTMVGQCNQYVSSYTWGTLKLATVKLGDDTVSSAPVQIIGGSNPGVVPTACAVGTANTDGYGSGTNGLIGASSVGLDYGQYYACPATGCTGMEEQDLSKTQKAVLASGVWDSAKQKASPINMSPQTLLKNNNNGVILDLPAIPPAGAPHAEGTLTFGINTQPNNQLDATTAVFEQKTFPGHPTPWSVLQISVDKTDYLTVLDSGTPLQGFANLDKTRFPTCGISEIMNGIAKIIPDPTLDATLKELSPALNYYCPLTPQSVSLSMKDAGGTTRTSDFPIGNGISILPIWLLNKGGGAFRTLTQVAPSNQTGFAPVNNVLMGLPSFYGKRVFVSSSSNGQTTKGPDGIDHKNGFYAIATSKLPAVSSPSGWGLLAGWVGDFWLFQQWH